MSAKTKTAIDKSASTARPGLCIGICLLLIAITLAIYWRTMSFQFSDLDDGVYITKNAHIMQESHLTPGYVSWAFTGKYDANWIPLTWISFMIDHQFAAASDEFSGEEDPAPYHVTNVVLHVLNTLLVFFFLTAVTRSRWKSAMVAALFAVHPIHVESVAWISERKDVLSTFFLMLTLLAYAWYCRKPGVGRYVLMTLAFALGLMAKSMLVTLPILLLLLDFWPLARVAGWTRDKEAEGSPPRKLVLEKLPLFVLSVTVGVVTIFAQGHAGTVQSIVTYPIGVRLANAAISYISYIGKTFWPANLACLYPHPRNTIPTWEVAASVILLLAALFGAIRVARRSPWITVGWLWYVVALLPVIGIVQVGTQAMADRYTYVPLIGLFVMVVWGVPDLLATVDSRHIARWLLAGIACIVVVVLVILSCMQVGYWRESTDPYTRALQVTKDNAAANAALGVALGNRGDVARAVQLLRRAVGSDPASDDAQFCLGTFLAKQGKVDEAIPHFQKAISINPNHVAARSNLGLMLATEGKVDDAIAQYEEALRIDPGYEAARNNLELAKAQKSRKP